MATPSVIIVGAGPTGLMLAGELALAGVEVALVERRTDAGLVGMRARGVHARTIELFEQRGIAERFLAEGQTFSSVGFAWIRLDISDLPSRHPYGLALAQNDIERLLAQWVEELGVEIRRGCSVESIFEDDGSVRARFDNGELLEAQYIVGCDGGRSTVRKSAGIAFEGFGASISNLIAEVEMTGEPPIGLRHDALGVHSITKEPSGRFRVLVTEPDVSRTGEPGLDDLREALEAVYGSDFGSHSPVTISRFTDVTLQASSYRKGRVLLAGDAAHIHYPAGGLGLNLGLQDSVNLGWKLAQVVKGASTEELLDTYHSEQQPVAARVLRNTMAQVALLGRLDDRKAALRAVFAELLAMEEPRRGFGAAMSGLDIHYALGAGHPLIGRRMPDLDLETRGATRRLTSFLHEGRAVLLDLGIGGRPDIAPWADRLQLVEAAPVASWEIPVVGAIPPAAGVLVRPDGHVAWVEDANDETLQSALTRWLGDPAKVPG